MNPVSIVMIEDDPGHARLIERNIRRAGVNNEIVPFNRGVDALAYLLGEVNRVLTRPLTPDRIVGVYAGLRPLLAGESDETSRLSREHAVVNPVPGLVLVAGGKYTTYRVMAADAVVIGVPFYNFTIPSSLKSWIDHLTRAGITFRYTATGPEGLIKGKKVYLALASGGVYSEGPMQGYDFAAPYLRTVLGFLGMSDVTVARAEGVKMPEFEPAALRKGIDSVAA